MTKRQVHFSERAFPSIDRNTCNDCGLCAEVCGGHPLTLVDGRVEIDPEPALGCLGCGQCMMICPTGSITVSGRDLSPKDMLDLPSRDSCASADQQEALLLRRRAIRHFKRQEVSRDLVDRVVRIASTAPMGIPPSQVGIVVVHGHDMVKAFSDDMLRAIKRSMRFMNPAMMVLARPFMRRTSYESFKEFVLPLGRLLEEEMTRGRDPLLYGAPTALLFHFSPCAEPADSYIAATYAMIAAESLGLGTCMIGMVAPFLVRDRRLMKKYGIPRNNKPSIVLIMGYPRIDFKRGVRRRFASVLYHRGVSEANHRDSS